MPGERPRHLRAQSRKRSELALATEATVMQDRACPAVLASPAGHWTWAMMVLRPAFAVLRETYGWIREFADDSGRAPRRPPPLVKQELAAVASPSI